MSASQYTTQATLELQFTAQRVAEVFSSADASGASTGAVDTAALTQCIVDSSAEIEEILGVEYAVPFASPFDPAIIEMVGVFVMYRGTLLRRPEFTPGGQRASSPYEVAYKAALKRCEDIKENKRRLANATLKPKNIGGTTTNANPVNAQPFYFIPDPDTGQGGFGQY